MVDKVDKEVDNKGVDAPKLTPAEQDVLKLLSKEFLSPKKIAIRRRCSKQAVSKLIKNLKQKGAINSAYQAWLTKPDALVNHVNQIRLHGQEFNIKLLFKDQRYKEALDRGNVVSIDGNTVRLYRDSLEIYSGQNFYADDVQKATARSFEYWNRFFIRLEHELKVIFVKPRSQNIKLVKAHYAECHNELARDCEVSGEKITVYARDDGKLWFLIDNSFNLREAETVHPQTAKQDMGEVVKPFFNDLRENPVVPSQILKMISSVLEVQKIGATMQQATQGEIVQLVKLLKPAPAQQEPKIRRPDYFG